MYTTHTHIGHTGKVTNAEPDWFHFRSAPLLDQVDVGSELVGVGEGGKIYGVCVCVCVCVCV